MSKKLMLLLLLCSGLFASDLCKVSTDKIDKLYSSMIIDLRNHDDDSLAMNFASFKFWLDSGIVYCNKPISDMLLKQKSELYPRIQNILKGK